MGDQDAVIAESAAISFQEHLQQNVPSAASSSALSLGGVVGMLQVVLATRRAARHSPDASTRELTQDRAIDGWQALVSWDALTLN